MEYLYVEGTELTSGYVRLDVTADDDVLPILYVRTASLQAKKKCSRADDAVVGCVLELRILCLQCYVDAGHAC